MRRTSKTYIHEHYKFIDFASILNNIRDSFLEEMEENGEQSALLFKSRFQCRYLKHCVLTEVFMATHQIDPTKTNVILMNGKCKVNTGGLFNALAFITQTVSVINSCKRNIPILIKNVECNFDDMDVFLETGEGEEFLLQVEMDREKLRRSTCTFRQFKQFIRKNGLKEINQNLIDKIEFKRLFFS